MKSLIVYSSKSGNTRKLADAVKDFLPGEIVSKPVEEKPDTDGYDLICVGFWFQAGKPDPSAIELLRNIDSPASFFFFATHGAAVGSDHVRNGMKQAEAIAASSKIIGTFSCQGEVNPALLDKAQSKNPPPPWINDAPNAVGHPDDEDISRLGKILQEVLSRV